MRIKELHLRNIASIEAADINFETDLCDQATGLPAPIFLISGDTGVGKSVLLDGISLALYKTTPRIESVSDPQRNEFRMFSDSKEPIGIKSISQYTRLGISHKDDCYSEVLFEGNDNITYRARLELGLKSTGSYSTPKWTVMIGNNDWVRVDTHDSQIEKAVGLSFKQFNRMAMLAQGQFAAFLCGEKKEREEILEQLTNTEIFSAYGMAIKRLFDRYKKARDLAEKALQTEQSHLLDPEQTAQLQQQLTAETARQASIAKQLSLLDSRILRSSRIADSRKQAAEAQQRIQAAHTAMASPEYQSLCQLVHNWDLTEPQRAHLDARQKALETISNSKAKVERCRQRFDTLSAHLLYQTAQNEHQARTLQAEKTWLDSQAHLAPLFARLAEIELLFDNHSSHLSDIQKQKQSKQDEESQTPKWQQALEQAQHDTDKAQSALADKQKTIDLLTTQRDNLKPDTIIRDLDLVNTSLSLLSRWSDRLASIAQSREKIQQSALQLDQQQQQLRQAQDTLQTKKTEHQQALAAHELLSTQYNTLKFGIEEDLKTLRHRLIKEHAETCPLCGQHIDHIILDHDFAQLLTPLEQALDKAKTTLDKASEALAQAQSTADRLNGQYEAHANELATARQNADTLDQQLKQEVLSHGWDYDQQLPSKIGNETTLLSNRKTQLQQQQEQAETLQKQIQSLLKEKEQLTKQYTSALDHQHAVASDLDRNKQLISQLAARIDDTTRALAANDQRLDNLIAPTLPQWRDDVAASKTSLQRQATAYSQRNNAFLAAQNQLGTATTLCQQIEDIQQQVLAYYPQWQQHLSPIKAPQPIALKDWNELLAFTAQLHSRIHDAEEEQRQHDTYLQQWYSSSGQTEEALLHLISQKDLLQPARTRIADTETALKSATDALNEALRAIAENRQALHLQESDPDPDTQQLDTDRALLNNQLNEATSQAALAQGSLDTDAANRQRTLQAQQQFDTATQAYNKWYAINQRFGGTRFRTLVQTHILRPLLTNANLYLQQITDRYRLTCSEENEKLSILVLDRYNKGAVRSATVLSGGERFMVSLALSLALSSLNRPDLNVNILFIDEGFGTLDEKSLDSVMSTLEKLQYIAGQSNRRVGIISHREELNERIRTQIHISRHGEGRSRVEIRNL